MCQRLVIFILSSCLLLSGCQRWFSWVHIVDVQQGNIIEKKTAAKIHRGMSKAQVRRILGDSVLQSVFMSNHWDYVYTEEKAHGHFVRKRYRIFFNSVGRVTRVMPIT